MKNFRKNLCFHCCHAYERHFAFDKSVQEHKISSSVQAPSTFGPSCYSYLQNCTLLPIHNIYSLFTILLLASTLHLLMMLGLSPMFGLQQLLLSYNFKVEVERRFSLTKRSLWFGSDRKGFILPSLYIYRVDTHIWVCSLKSLFSQWRKAGTSWTEVILFKARYLKQVRELLHSLHLLWLDLVIHEESGEIYPY